jgi:cytochrome c oxidase subunit 1
VLLAGALGLALINLIVALRFGERSGPNPWGSRSYEWLTPSPPPVHNFPVSPTFARGPYDYDLTEEEARGRIDA